MCNPEKQKKMKKFNMTFICEHGRYELEECKTLPTQEKMSEAIENLKGVGLGRTKKVVIDKIEL